MNATEHFLGPEAGWAQAEIQLDDVHGLWGGQTVTVTGAGRVRVRRVGPTFREGQWQTTLTEIETRALFWQFIEQDFVTLYLPDHIPVPDEAHPRLTLTNARGEAHSVLKWARQSEGRFEAVYAGVQAIADTAIRAGPD